MTPARGHPMPARRPRLTVVLAAGLAAIACVLAATPARAQDRAPGDIASTRPRVGLVLSGGGARGLSHIGVLKVLDELRIPVDAIAATSMGSIVGGLYASGMGADQMETEVRAIDWARMFSDEPPRADLTLREKDYQALYPLPLEIGLNEKGFSLFKGAISGANLELWLHRRLIDFDNLSTFDALPVPFRAIATDMVDGREVVIDRGDLAKAIRSSMSIPGVFAPAEVGGRILGDGGLVNNLPVDVVKAMGVDVVIAVNIGTPLMTREQLSSVLGFTAQTLNILTEQNVRASLARLGPMDILIAPDLGATTSFDFGEGARLIAAGEHATRAAAPRLAALSRPPVEYAAWVAERQRPATRERWPLDRVVVEGTQRVNPEAVKAIIAFDPGKPLDIPRLEDELGQLGASGDYERIDYSLRETPVGRELVIDLKEKSWGPNYFRFGLQLESDLEGDSSFNLIVGHKLRWVNRWGAEWLNEFSVGRTRAWGTEFYQPLGLSTGPFVSVYGLLQANPLYVYFNDQRVAEYDVDTRAAGVDVGWAFGRYGEARLGLRYEHLRARPTIATPDFQPAKGDDGGFSLRLRYDRLDNPYFATTGARFVGELFSSIAALSNDEQVTRGRAEGGYAFPVGPRGAINLGARVAASDRSTVEFTNGYQLGGFLELSGLRTDQLSGSYLARLRAIYFHNMGRLALAGSAWYLGASAEIGNAWLDRSDVSWGNTIKAGSVFVAADTWLGPFYLAYGRTSTGENAWYIYLGRP